MKKGLSILVILCMFSFIILMQGCKKSTLPELTTSEVSGVTLNTAISGGEITSDGNEAIIARGVCWNTSGDPVITDLKTSDGKGSDSYTSNLSGLVKGSVYYVRAYATNSVGTAYGEEIIFSTQIDDVDGNQYNTTPIGSQVWMAENLKTTKYNDNTTIIPKVTGATAWITLTTHAYCWYDNDEVINKPLYGGIYNFYAVNTGKLCPTDWHVATDADYGIMEVALGLPQAAVTEWEWRGTDQGKQMKSAAGWSTGENGTNTSGFSALPGGYRYYENGAFNGINILGYWWTGTEAAATTAYYRRLDGNNNGVYRASAPKKAGKSVRCVKD